MSYPEEKETFRRVVGENLAAGVAGDVVKAEDRNEVVDFLERLQDILGVNLGNIIKKVEGKIIENITIKGGKLLLDTTDIQEEGAFLEFKDATGNVLLRLDAVDPSEHSYIDFGGLIVDMRGLTAEDADLQIKANTVLFPSSPLILQGGDPVEKSVILIREAAFGTMRLKVYSNGRIEFDNTGGEEAVKIYSLKDFEGSERLSLLEDGHIQSTHDYTFLTENKGPVLKDRTTGQLRRIKCDNGVLTTEAA